MRRTGKVRRWGNQSRGAQTVNRLYYGNKLHILRRYVKDEVVGWVVVPGQGPLLHRRSVSADTYITRLHVQQQSRRVPQTPPARPRQWRCLDMTSVPAPPLDWEPPDGRRDRARPAQLPGSPALRPEETT